MPYHGPTPMRNKIRTLTINLEERSYPIHIGKDLLDCTSVFNECIGKNRTAIVTDETVAPLYLEQLKATLMNATVTEIVLPAGEEQKTLLTFERICTQLLQNRVGRDTTLVALGGGVIGDITGFVAACYQRGIDFIQVPTTLLAQVDSSVGGKTGVNHPLGKNMIGAFYQPRAVVIDLETLKTLPSRHFSAGIAEIIKYGMILDTRFFDWIQSNMNSLMERNEDIVAQAILNSCQIKARVVARDERESSGHRMLLNLGHSFGHAIEATAGYGKWLHGEAVGCGLLLAATLSHDLGYIKHEEVTKVTSLLKQAQLPYNLPANFNIDDLLNHMARDKKNVDGKYRLVLLKKIGEAFVTDKVTRPVIAEFLKTFNCT